MAEVEKLGARYLFPGQGLSPASARGAERARPALTVKVHLSVLDLLSPTPVSVDEVIRQSGLIPATVQTVLLELELAGWLERYAGGWVSVAS